MLSEKLAEKLKSSSNFSFFGVGIFENGFETLQKF